MRAAQRPVFLDLTKIRLPPNALVSILHRITGVFLIVSIPLLLALWGASLRSAEGFAAVSAVASGFWGRLLLFFWLWLLLHHLFAGLRHLALEFGIGESRAASLQTAWAAIGVGVVAALLVTWWI